MNINGFTLKGVKEFKGHEGETCHQGHIYLNKKKVGWFSSSYMMGPMDIKFTTPEIEKLFLETALIYDKAYPMGLLYYNAPFKLNPKFKNYFTIDAEEFVLELISIYLAEKDYKKKQKNGIPLVVYTYVNEETLVYNFNKIIPRKQVEAYFKAHNNSKVVLYVDSLSVFDLEV